MISISAAPTRRPSHRNRGFSILAVLFAVVILALVGSTAYLYGTIDSTSAESTALRSQALAAAETGMALFSVAADPTTIPDETEDEASLVPVDLPTHSASTNDSTQYLIMGAGNSGGVGHVIVEGRVLRGGRIVSRARLGGTLMMEQRDDPYEGTAGHGPTGANVQRGGRRPFTGGPTL